MERTLDREFYFSEEIFTREKERIIVLQTGGLDFAPRISAIPLTNYSGSMDAAGVSYELLTPRRSCAAGLRSA